MIFGYNGLLTEDIIEAKLRDALVLCGSINDLRVCSTTHNTLHKYHTFIDFFTEEARQNALLLQGIEVAGGALTIKYAVPKEKKRC